MPIIQDWVVELGFSDKKVREGLSKVDKLMERTDRVQARAEVRKVNAEKVMLKTSQTRLQALKQETNINNAKASLINSITAAERLGINVDKSRNKLQGKNLDNIKNTNSELRKKIASERRSLQNQRAINKETKKVLAPEERAASFSSKAGLRRRAEGTILGLQETRAGLGAGAASEKARANIDQQVKDLRGFQRRAEIAKTAKDVSKLGDEFVVLSKKSNAYVKQAKKVTREMTLQDKATKGFNDSLRNLGRSYVSVFAGIAAGTSVFNVGKQLDSVSASMLAASGNAETAAKDFEFIKQISLEMGKDLTVSARGFAQLGTATRALGFDINDTKEIFLAAQEGATAFGLSTEDTQGILRAFTQIAGKGNVQMEELDYTRLAA